MTDNNNELDGINIPEVQIVQPAPQPAPQNWANKKTGVFVCSIVFTILAIVMTAVTLFVYFSVFTQMNTSSEQLNSFLTFFVFLLWYGWFTYLPALIFTIVGLSCSAVGLKSSKKGFKVTCAIFLALSIIVLVVLVFSLFLAGLLINVG